MKKIISSFKDRIQHYNHEKYWKKRALVVDPKSKKSKITKYLYLKYIKGIDTF